MSITTPVTTFYPSRSAARASGKPVKDSGMFAAVGKRWYTVEQAEVILTNQQIFDTVAVHLLTQKVRAFEGGYCRYRTSNGLMCAAGKLIKDAAYTEEIEGRTVNDQPVDAALIASGVAGKSLSLVRDLQRYHDSRTEYRVSGLQDIANKFHLNTKALDKFRDGK